MLANVDLLIGRSFVSYSDNICRISKLGEGGIEVWWKNKPTALDMQEFDSWAVEILGPRNISVESQSGGKASEGARQKGRDAYERWKRKLEG